MAPGQRYKGMGEVAALVQGQRFTGAARESEGRELARGSRVTVKAMVGGTLIVVVAKEA